MVQKKESQVTAKPMASRSLFPRIEQEGFLNCSITLVNLAQRAISGTGALPKKRGRQAFSRQTPPARQPKELARSPEFLEKNRAFFRLAGSFGAPGVARAAMLNPQAAAPVQPKHLYRLHGL